MHRRQIAPRASRSGSSAFEADQRQAAAARSQPARPALPSPLRSRAVHQIAFRPRLAQPQAERRHVVDQPPSRRSPRHRPAGSPASAAPAPPPPGPRSAGSPARCPPRPGRPRAASARSCGWSGCASRRPAHRAPARTGGARARRIGGLLSSPSANSSLRSVCVRQPHPMRQPLADAVGHFRRAGLGEGQAEDRRRRRPAKQQAQHARRSGHGSCRSPPRPTARHGPADRTPPPARPRAGETASGGGACTPFALPNSRRFRIGTEPTSSERIE